MNKDYTSGFPSWLDIPKSRCVCHRIGSTNSLCLLLSCHLFSFFYFYLRYDVGTLIETSQTSKNLTEHIKKSTLEFQKGSLKLQGSIWRQEVLKITRSWRHQKHSHEKLSARSWRHQRFRKSLEAEDHQKLEDMKFQNFIKCCSCHAYERRRNGILEQCLIHRNFEGIGCLSFGERWKRTIVQLYNHYLHYSVLCLQ